MEVQCFETQEYDPFSGFSNYIDCLRLYYWYFKKIPTKKRLTELI